MMRSYPHAQRVHPDRLHVLRQGREGQGPVVYWMHREQRLADNWGLLQAQDHALGQQRPLLCVFCLAPGFLRAGKPHYEFMLAGLAEVARESREYNIPFVLLKGEPGEVLPGFLRRLDAALLVTDFAPLRISRNWRRKVCEAVSLPVLEVDGHNVAPCRRIADKQQVGARTLRPRIAKRLHEYLEPFPELATHPHTMKDELPEPGWREADEWLGLGNSESESSEFWASFRPTPGGEAAGTALSTFLEERLPHYAARCNDPNAGAVSRLSAYFHFGQLAPQRAALAAVERYGHEDENVQAWLEELVVRRELSDNFCLYNSEYDSLRGAPAWARESLEVHRKDKRPYVYDLETFDKAGTHSPLWNAAQQQLRRTGFMHGYMRMYWAKKILEWSATPEEAVAIALELNDRWQLDGRDPNGYVGVLWSVAGLHDRPWKEREIYGKIRYMNANGCRRKFDVGAYVQRWTREAPLLER